MTDDTLGEILSRQEQAEVQKRAKAAQPKGTEPRVEWNERTGQGTVAGSFPADAESRDWSKVLEFLGYDAKLFEVDDKLPVDVRAWEMPIGEGVVRKMHYAKAKIRLRRHLQPANDLVKSIRARRPHKPVPKKGVVSGSVDVLCLSDWQIGKAMEFGGGTPETIERVKSMHEDFRLRRKLMVRAGTAAERLVVVGMGDLTERCQGNYPNQPYVTDQNEREQARIARDLLYRSFTTVAPLYDHIVATRVASNHGQNRASGTREPLTGHDDDSDLTLFECLAERLGENPEAFGHIHFHEGADPLVATLDIAGTGVAFTHGHQIKGTVSQPVYKFWEWWTRQLAGRLPAGDCDVLVGAHFHHPYSLAQQGRTLYGCPALDGGSRWLTNSNGVWSDPGTLVFTMDEGSAKPRSYSIL